MISLFLTAAAAIGPVPAFSFPKQDVAPLVQDRIDDWRSRAWSWCNRDGARDPVGLCLIDQDSAILEIARANRAIADRGAEAELIDVRTRFCTDLFADHGSNDLRILAVCMSDLATSVRVLRLADFKPR